MDITSLVKPNLKPFHYVDIKCKNKNLLVFCIIKILFGESILIGYNLIPYLVAIHDYWVTKYFHFCSSIKSIY